MTLPSAQFRGDELPGPAAVLLQILPRLLLPTGWSSLTVAAGVSSLAGALVVSLTPGVTVTGAFSPALVSLAPHPSPPPSPHTDSASSSLLPSSPALLPAPPGLSVPRSVPRPLPDERVLVAAGPA